MHRLTSEWVTVGWTQLWQVTLLAVAVYVATRIFGRHRPHVGYVLWMLVIVKCLTPPIWASPVGFFSLVQAPTPANLVATQSTQPPAAHEPPVRDVEATVAAVDSPQSKTVGRIEPAAVAAPVAALDRTTIAIRVLGCLWLAGVLGVAAAIAARWAALRRHLDRAGTVAGADVLERVSTLARQLGVRAIPRIVAMTEPIVPAVFGVVRPTILLPQTLLDSDKATDLDAVLAHELIHIRRRDALAARLQLIAQAVWWFHPLVWWANREARHERERCCDEAVVAGLDCAPIRYAATLVAVAELAARARRIPAVAMIGPRQTTASRLEHITRRSQQFRKRTPLASLVGVVLLSAAVLPGAALVPRTAWLTASESAAQKPASSNATLAIAGVCLDSNEQPLSGVDVHLVQRLPPDNRFDRRNVRTAADGRFRFEGVPPFENQRGRREYLVVARKGGLSTATHDVRNITDVGDDFKLKLGPGASLKGQVTDSDGKPLAGVTVWMPWNDPPIPGVLSDRTDAQGHYEIDGLGAWPAKNLEVRDPKTGQIIGYHNVFIRVALPGYGKTLAFYHAVPDTVNVVLAREGVIEGRVVDSVTGKPGAQIRVRCQGTDPTNPMDGGEATTDDLGRYRIEGLLAGAYNVRPDTNDDRTVIALDSLAVHPGKTTHAPDLKLIKGGFLEGKLVDAATGKAISKNAKGRNLRIGMHGPARPKSGANVQSVLVDDDGKFRIRVAPGVNYPYIMNPELWERVEGREKLQQEGISVPDGEVVRVEIRILP
jgi:beta-lactamase regulating signal transducer with metallopeptidase domain